MSDIDHGAEAADIIAMVADSSYAPATGVHNADIAIAQVHATLAAVEVLHEIAHAVGVVRAAPRCEVMDTLGQQCRLRAGHDGLHKVGLGEGGW